jgi:tripartite ATP-independent transporter DctM subunit
VTIIADAVTLLAGVLLASGGLSVMSRLGGVSTSLAVPEWIRFAAPCLGGGLIVLMTALHQVANGQTGRLLAATIIATGLFAAIQLQLTSALPPSAVAGLIALIGLVVGAPLAHTLLVAVWLAIPFGAPLTEPAIVSTSVAGISKFLLLAIPFFLLAGDLFAISGLVDRLVRLAAALVGHLRGGVAQTALLTSVLFSGASGSSVANAAFGAKTFAPALSRQGYTPPQAGAIIAATSVLDNVIPPSIAFLILAAATELSVGRLLVGGFFAGLVMAAALAVSIRLTAAPITSDNTPVATAERWRAARAAIPALGLGVVVLAGIRFGVVTPTEAAAVASLYTLIACLAGRASGRSIWAAFRDAAIASAAIGLLIGSAAPFAFLLAIDDIGGSISTLSQWFGDNPLTVLVFANLVLLAAGMVLDIGAAILLLSPILLPLAVQSGLDPVHFGIIVVVNLMIGGLTPPVGMLVYVVAGTMRISSAAIFRAVLPHVVALIGALAVISATALFLIPA